MSNPDLRYVTIDGTRLVVISGGDGDDVDLVDAIETAAPDVAEPEPAAPAEDAWSTRTPEDMRAEIEKLRKESGGRRTKLKEYEAIEGLSPENRAEILQLAGAVRDWNPDAIKSRISTWAQGFGMTVAEAKAAAAEVVAEATDDGDEPLTAKALQAALTKFQEDQRAEQTKQATEAKRREDSAAIQAKVKGLGYDAEEDEVAFDLLYSTTDRLIRKSGGTLDVFAAIDQAHEALDGWKLSVIDGYKDGKRKDAVRVPAPSGVGGTPAKDTTPTTLDEATKRATARVAESYRRR